ncbi:MAG: hypothetical protein HC888_08375 [Candidatus Competibacteraceae bacterium]|nr:hypothetical protein [Candidatus Competibacteraceae bacterium]
MPFTASAPTPLVVTGKILLVITPDEDPLYSAVSPLQSPWLLGSSIQIEEVWEIESRIVLPELVQVFKDYPFDRYKLGNYSIVSADNVPKSAPQDSGYLHYLVQRISTTSIWTIGIDSGGLSVTDGTEEIDNCNFGTREVTLSFGGVSLALQSPVQDNSLFKIRKTSRPAVLQDTAIRRQAPKLGLFLFPGIELVSAEYSMSAVNLLKADATVFAPNACSALDPDCDAEFLAFRRTNFPADADYPGSFADGQSGLPEGTHIYSTLAAAEAGGDAPPGAYIYTCTDGGTRDYFLANSFG